MATAAPCEDVLRAGPNNVWTQSAAGMAFTSAINGRNEEARRHLDILQNHELNAEDKHSAAMARTALPASHAGPGSNPFNARRAADLHRQVLSAWPGGTQTNRGRHYRREPENFLHRRQLDAALARFPPERPALRGRQRRLQSALMVLLCHRSHFHRHGARLHFAARHRPEIPATPATGNAP